VVTTEIFINHIVLIFLRKMENVIQENGKSSKNTGKTLKNIVKSKPFKIGASIAAAGGAMIAMNDGSADYQIGSGLWDGASYLFNTGCCAFQYIGNNLIGYDPGVPFKEGISLAAEGKGIISDPNSGPLYYAGFGLASLFSTIASTFWIQSASDPTGISGLSRRR